MTYIKVNDTVIQATINGKTKDHEWNDRASKAITMIGDYASVDALFQNGTSWSIVVDVNQALEDGTVITVQEEYNNSEYNIRGDLTVHTDGTCTVKMGKITEMEDMAAALAVLGV